MGESSYLLCSIELQLYIREFDFDFLEQKKKTLAYIVLDKRDRKIAGRRMFSHRNGSFQSLGLKLGNSNLVDIQFD